MHPFGNSFRFGPSCSIEGSAKIKNQQLCYLLIIKSYRLVKIKLSKEVFDHFTSYCRIFLITAS